MKAVISSTNDSMYSFFIPITTWCWNKLGVDIVLFVPNNPSSSLWFAMNQINKDGSNRNRSYGFICPEHKSATYSQVSRLYAACLDLPEDEILITSDVDMGAFVGISKFLEMKVDGHGVVNEIVSILGYDLVPKGQYPMCYARGNVTAWRNYMNTDGRTYQKCLDDLLGNIEAEHFRGNYWGKDQETLWVQGQKVNKIEVSRARPGTQFAANRVDRDDINWRHYVDDSLVDAHFWRPGYEENNFKNILELLQMKYPNDNFGWLIEYRNKYIELL